MLSVALLLANNVIVGWLAMRGWLLVPSAVFLGDRYLFLANCVIVGLSSVRRWLLVPSAVLLGDRYLY